MWITIPPWLIHDEHLIDCFEMYYSSTPSMFLPWRLSNASRHRRIVWLIEFLTSSRHSDEMSWVGKNFSGWYRRVIFLRYCLCSSSVMLLSRARGLSLSSSFIHGISFLLVILGLVDSNTLHASSHSWRMSLVARTAFVWNLPSSSSKWFDK